MSAESSTIVIGVDGSPGSEQAVRWAADLAAERDLTLHIVHAVQLINLSYGAGLAGPAPLYEEVEEDARRILDEAVALAKEIDSELKITTQLSNDPPIPLLVELSRTARIVVVGNTGRGGFPGMVIGSVAAAVANHAKSPVAVVRGRLGTIAVPDGGPVVVGIDGSPVSERAIAMAFDEASWRGAQLIAVHVWSDATYDSAFGTARFGVGWGAAKEEEEALLAQRLAGWQEKYPDVTVQREVLADRPRHVLLGWSEKAQLVVVGSRGRGGFSGLLLGSTSQALVQHAGCPVLVVRSEDEEL